MARKYETMAICYDFDGTLSPGYMQNYDFIPSLGLRISDFWSEVKRHTKEQNGDEILIYMGQMLRKAGADPDVKVTKDAFMQFGKTVELFSGVTDWFERIDSFGKEKEVHIEHFIISSGLREMIAGTEIAKHFKYIFASGFWYDKYNIAQFPAVAVNYTTKTQYLFRINKGSYDLSDNATVNKYTPNDERPVPFENIVFIGDGETDIPCFRLVKEQGGHSIAVYKPNTKGGKATGYKLKQQGRVNCVVPADYTENSPLDQYTKSIIDHVSVRAAKKRLE